MRVMLSGLLLTVCAFLAAPAGQQDPALQGKHDPADQAQKQFEEDVQAVFKGDGARAVDFIHPKVVKLGGGRAELIKASSELPELRKKASKGMDCTLETTPEAPGPVVKGGGELYTVVIYRMMVKGKGMQIQGRDYVVGVSGDGGKNWTFVDR
jgi:hypothetical protein